MAQEPDENKLYGIIFLLIFCGLFYYVGYLTGSLN